MSEDELTRIRIAMNTIKQTYEQYASGEIGARELAIKVQPNAEIIHDLVEGSPSFPQDTKRRFQGGYWDFYFIKDVKGNDDPTDTGAVDGMLNEISMIISATEGLLVRETGVGPDKEIEELKFKMERLTEQLAMGEISEETYKKATDRLEAKVERLKKLRKINKRSS